MIEIKILIGWSKERYDAKYGEECKQGNLWDYPIEELGYLAEGLLKGDREINTFALIRNRLWEAPNEEGKLTFREYCLDAIKNDKEFDAVIGDVDMPATFGFCDDVIFTPYCEEKYGKLLDSEVIVHADPTGRYTESVEVLFDDEEIGESFTYAVAGYISEAEYHRLFEKE